MNNKMMYVALIGVGCLLVVFRGVIPQMMLPSKVDLKQSALNEKRIKIYADILLVIGLIFVGMGIIQVYGLVK